MFNKKAIFAVLIPWVAFAAPSPLTNPRDPCTVSSALLILIPGAEWSLSNNDFSTFQLIHNSTFTAPSQSQVDSQIAACETTQNQIPALQLELSTTTAAVSAYPNLVAPTAIQQQQVTRSLARIQALKALLGL